MDHPSGTSLSDFAWEEVLTLNGALDYLEPPLRALVVDEDLSMVIQQRDGYHIADVPWRVDHEQENFATAITTVVNAAEDLRTNGFNVNDYVWVKLTNYGWSQHDEFYDKLDVSPPPHTDGWQRFELWGLMSMFGSGMFNGSDIPFEENRVFFSDPGVPDDQ